MTKKTTPISGVAKESIVFRFVADVLTKRAIAFVQTQHKFVQKVVKLKLSKDVVETIDKVVAMEKAYPGVCEVLGVEINSWMTLHNDRTQTLEYAPELRLVCNDVFNLITTIPDSFTIELDHEVCIDPDDWFWELMPDSRDTTALGKEWQKIQAIQVKLEADARTLYKAATKSIARKKTYESIEKGCPELVPYFQDEDDDAPCVPGLADMASCMRGKPTC